MPVGPRKLSRMPRETASKIADAETITPRDGITISATRKNGFSSRILPPFLMTNRSDVLPR